MYSPPVQDLDPLQVEHREQLRLRGGDVALVDINRIGRFYMLGEVVLGDPAGLDPARGPGLIFVTLPIAFGNMPGGHIVGFLFFVLSFFAAFSSVVGMLEPIVSWLEEHKGFSRPKMTLLARTSGWFLGIAAALSFNVWSDVKLPSFMPLVKDKGIFELLDFLVSNLLLPINALLIAIFRGLDNVQERIP